MKTKLISTIIAGTLATTAAAGALKTANSFDPGRASVTNIEKSLGEFSELTKNYISKAKELEELALSQNGDITSLVDKIDELRQLRTRLESEKEDLSKDLAASNSTNDSLTKEVKRLGEELDKANLEIEIANDALETLDKQVIPYYLDEAMFEELTIPDKIDVSDALTPDSTETVGEEGIANEDEN